MYIKDVTGSESVSGPIVLETIDGKIIDPQNVTNILNDHFLNIAKKVTSHLPQDSVYEIPDKLIDWINVRLPNKIKFDIPLISENDVLEALSNLDENKSTGVDGISAKVLKTAAAALCQPLTYIINNSLKSKVFPDIWKTAIVYPLHKSGSKTNADNYRPISVLCVLTKIVERHVHKHFYNFLDQYNLISEFQSGFRKHHSCDTSLTYLFNDWVNNLDNGNIIGNVSVDMRKAFDVINFDILLSKLALYGCSSDTVKWFESYVKHRKQYVHNKFNNSISETHETSYGVPQGSILGPLLFVVYINDFFVCINKCNYNQYADDTNVYAVGSDIYEIENKLIHDLLEVGKWCENSRLVINQNKSNSMIICSPYKIRFLTDTNMNLFLNGSNLESTNSQKILGLHFDNHLKFDGHIECLCKKMLSLSGLLWRIRLFLPETAKLLFYNSYFVPLMDYCITVWGQTNKTLIDKIYKIQKRILRVVSNDYFCDGKLLFLKYNNVMYVYERIEFQTAILVYKSLFENVPSYLQNMFEFSGINHNYNLRNNETNLVVPKPKTEILRKSFKYAGASVWNSLPYEIKISTSLNVFKSKLKWYIYQKR